MGAVKRLEDYSNLKQYKEMLGDITLPNGKKVHQHDFYRCHKCKRMLTHEQYRAWQEWAKDQPAEKEGEVFLHSCGSMKIAPAMPINSEWVMPAVVRYTLKLVLARGLAPWCDTHHCRFALPIIEFLVRPKEA
jgi:hypothetical protein